MVITEVMENTKAMAMAIMEVLWSIQTMEGMVEVFKTFIQRTTYLEYHLPNRPTPELSMEVYNNQVDTVKVVMDMACLDTDTNKFNKQSNHNPNHNHSHKV